MEVIVFVVLAVGGLIVFNFKRSEDQSHTPKDTYNDRPWPSSPGRKPAVASPQAQNFPQIPKSMKLTGKAYVIDGDTIKIKGTKIRLAGIDAPELNMPWGQKSKWAMVNICKGQIVTVELDGERSHDRLVGTCFLPDGRDIGAEIIKQGLALDLPHFSGGKYRQCEPEGARRKLCNGKFGHSSIRTLQRTRVRIRTNSN